MSKPGKQSTTEDILSDTDLSGLTAFVTGGNSGLGKETVRALAAHGAHVVAIGRSREKLDAAKLEVEKAHGAAKIDTLICDLASLESIHAAGREARERFYAAHLLINNAAVMACPFQHTADGFEMQFGTNHLGHFALTQELIPLLEAGAADPRGGRIVNLSSRGHFMSDIDLDDPHFEQREYDPWVSYGQAKTANVLFTVGLEKRLSSRGINALAVHPGGIMTNLGRHLSEEQAQALAERVAASDPDFEWKTPEQGAATQVWAATAPQLAGRGGLYCEDCHVARVDDTSTAGGVRRYALDKEQAERLWTMSEKMTGARYAA